MIVEAQIALEPDNVHGEKPFVYHTLGHKIRMHRGGDWRLQPPAQVATQRWFKLAVRVESKTKSFGADGNGNILAKSGLVGVLTGHRNFAESAVSQAA